MSPAVTQILETSGWTPQRRVEVPGFVPQGHPAAEILANLGGLTLDPQGPGLECARSDVRFETRSIDDPELENVAERIGQRLVQIATVSRAHAELYVDESGRCFGWDLVRDSLWLSGNDVWSSIENLVLGRMPTPILLPGQTSLEWFGQTIDSGIATLDDFAVAAE